MRPALRDPKQTALAFLAVGLLLAPVFTFTPILGFMGWFLGALVHETGHTVIAWAAGCPAFPAISLQGHAMARHYDQSVALALVILVALAYTAYRRRSLWLGGVALAYPVFAFTGMREFMFLLGGHLGELTFATIFFWRAIVGGFGDSSPERACYATCAWFLFGVNAWLCGGLTFSDAAQVAYRSNGSFGLTNDYIRVANELGVGLGTVAFLMLLVTLAVPFVAWTLTAEWRRAISTFHLPAQRAEQGGYYDEYGAARDESRPAVGSGADEHPVVDAVHDRHA